jgi:hypothetical protein
VCNLQSDQSGVAKPIARETKMEGSIAVPMLVGDRTWRPWSCQTVTYKFEQAEIDLLLQIGSLIGSHLA